LKELGIEPPRTRRYLIRWLERFRAGKFGVGGDFKQVENGTAELNVLQIKENPTKPIKLVVNVPSGKSAGEIPEEERVRVRGYHVKGSRTITGPCALPVKGAPGVARVTLREGMWEDKRGHKIDGGERRRAEVRFKRRLAERRAQKERIGM